MENTVFDQKLKDSEDFLKRAGIRTSYRKERYVIINTSHLDGMALPKHKDFTKLKAALDDHNEQVRKATAEGGVIYSYSWKHSLFTSLRNMLVEIANTEQKGLVEKFITKTKTWFDNKMEKKRQAGELEVSVNTSSYSRSTRAVSDNSRVLSSAMTKRVEADNSLNISAIQPEGDSIDQKSFFAEGISEIMPSQYRTDILRDYEEGNRSMHDAVDPPYERILHYERKVPKGILKPLAFNRKGKKVEKTQEIEITKVVSILKDEEIEENSASEKGSEGDDDKEDKEDKEDREDKEDKDENDGDAPEKVQVTEEGQENKPEGMLEPIEKESRTFKPGIVTPAVKIYQNDRITRKMYTTKDQQIPMEIRSAYSHYISSGTNQELSLEKRWRDSMQKKVVERREATEFRAYMKQWSHAKARMEEEIGRRQDSSSLGSCFGKRAFYPRAQSALPDTPAKPQEVQKTQDDDSDSERLNRTDIGNSREKITVYQETREKQAKPKVIDIGELRNRNSSLDRSELNKTIEGDISRLRIQKVKKFCESSLFQSRGVSSDIGEDGAYSYNRPTSLSVYDSENTRNHTPFSVVYGKARGYAFMEKQISVVSEIKNKLAKMKTKISLKNLENSILPPVNVSADTSVLLPEPGKGLLFNPFIKNREKKKRVKKRK